MAKRIDSTVRMYAQEGQFSGSILVARDAGAIYRGAFGLANRELAVQNTVDTRFRIGSITKAFTAVLILQQVEQGRLRLDGAVTEYLPSYGGPNGSRISVRQLLTHTAGLRDLGDFPRYGNDFPPIVAKVNAGFTDTDELVRLIAGYQPLFEPGARYGYSNDGYVLLQAILEKVTAKSYGALLAERILGPAGMKDTGMASRAALVPRRASGYDRTFDGYENAAPILVAANGGLYSTVDDLFLFWRALSAGSLLTQESKALMFAPTPSVTAFGWKVRGTPEAMLIADGSLPGFTSLMVISDSARQVIITLANTREMAHRVGDLCQAVDGAVSGQPVAPPRRSLAEDAAAAMWEHGIESALQEAGQRRGSSRWYESESEFNGLGYFLLARGRSADAVQVFEWTAQNHPASWNAFDSLGEAYVAAGETAMAVRSYRRSLELNPQNANASAMLEKLQRP